MKKFGALTNLADDTYEELKKKYLAARRREDPNASLTAEDEAAINAELLELMHREILEARPTAAPGDLLRALAPFAPRLRLTTPQEREQRTARRERAAGAYARGRLLLHGHFSGRGDLPLHREDNRACRALTPEELAAYNEAQRNKDEKGMALCYFRAVQHTVDRFGDILSCDLSDDQLIELYPSIANAVSLMIEAHSLMERAKKYRYDPPSPETLEKYDREVIRLMTGASLLEKRIALLADPYYPYLYLEAFREAEPERLAEYSTYAETYGSDPVEDAGITLLADSDPQPEPPPQVPEKGGALHGSDNLLFLTVGFQDVNRMMLLQRIADTLGLSTYELRDNAFLCDREGKLHSLDDATLCDLLRKGGVYYAVNRLGNTAPVPVLLDLTKEVYTPLVGKEEIAGAGMQLPPRPSLNWFAFLYNWFTEWRLGPSEAMVRYRDMEKKYQAALACLRAKEALEKQPLPEAVVRKDRELKLAAQLEDHRRAAENALRLIRSLPPGQEARLERTLGYLLTKTAFAEGEDSPLRRTVFALLRVYDPGFDELRDTDEFLLTPAYREFVRKLLREQPGLLARLQSADLQTARDALTLVTDRFLAHFTAGGRDTPVSEEFLRVLEEERAAANAAKDVQPGKLVTENRREVMEKGRDNGVFWQNLVDLYGPVRRLRPDWMPESSSRIVYTMDDWLLMQESAVPVSELRVEEDLLSQETFASLAMLLCLRRVDYFTPENLHNTGDGPYTMPFEDVFLTADGPRDNTWIILRPLIEPNRAKLRGYLREMNDPAPDRKGPSGKELLARDLAAALRIYAQRISRTDWGGRKHSAMASVGGVVLNFIQRHKMLELVLQNGLTQEELESVRIASAISRISNAAFNAEDDLRRAQEGELALSEEEKLNCIHRIMLLKALQADTAACKGKTDTERLYALEQERRKPELKALWESPYLTKQQKLERNNQIQVEFNRAVQAELDTRLQRPSPTARSLLTAKDPFTDRSPLGELSLRMLSPEKRAALAKGSPGAIYNTIRCDGKHPMNKPWENTLRQEEEKLAALEARLDALEQEEKNRQRLLPIRTILRDGKRASKLALADLSDEELLGIRKEQQPGGPGREPVPQKEPEGPALAQ